MKFRPLHDRVVVRRVDNETKTTGGIIIPDTAAEKPQQGEIIAAGPGARDETGKIVALDVKKGDTSRTIAGYKCDNWNVTIGQFSKSEQCFTNELKFPVQAWDMYRSYADSMKSMMSAFGPMARSMTTMQEQLKKLKGFPLANTTTTSVMGRRSVSTSEVTSIKRGSIPASVWEIPAGYEKVDNPMTKAMARRGKS